LWRKYASSSHSTKPARSAGEKATTTSCAMTTAISQSASRSWDSRLPASRRAVLVTPSSHHAWQPQRKPRKRHQNGQAQDVGPHERQHPAEDGRRAELGDERSQDEHVHADGGADEADLDHAHDDDAEPDRIEAQVHDDREEDR